MDKLRLAVAGATGWAARSRSMRSLSAVFARAQDDNDGQRGQGLAEYALILALIAIVAIASLVVLGNSVVQLFEDIINEGFTFVQELIGS